MELLSKSSCRANILIKSFKDNKKQMVIDNSVTINQFTQLDSNPLSGIWKMVGEITKYKTFYILNLTNAYHQVVIKS